MTKNILIYASLVAVIFLCFLAGTSLSERLNADHLEGAAVPVYSQPTQSLLIGYVVALLSSICVVFLSSFFFKDSSSGILKTGIVSSLILSVVYLVLAVYS